MLRFGAFLVILLSLAGCHPKPANPLAGDWEIILGGTTTPISGPKMSATFNADGTVTMHFDSNLAITWSTKSPYNSYLVHETFVGTYALRNQGLTIRLFEEQVKVDSFPAGSEAGHGPGAKELSQPMTSKLIWKSPDEFQMDFYGGPTTFKRVKNSAF